MDGRFVAYGIYFILIGSFVGYIIYIICYFILEEIRDARDKMILDFRGRFDSGLRDRYEKFFLGRFTYYDKLPDKLRVKFLIRVRKFVRSKSFEGRKELEVTEEMKAMVAAAAVQLTFGLENYMLDHFSKIIIYPQAYYSPVTGFYHMGEANPKGVLVISWKDYLQGYATPTDTYNVGLHEMSHALELEERLGGEYDFYFSGYYEKWKRITEEQYQNVREGGDSFFRKYAGTDRHEFFAVCIEHFFEASGEFRLKLPEVYNHLCILLNQDPLSKDTQVAKLKHKSSEEMRAEARTSVEIFATKYSFTEFLVLPTLIIAFISFFMIAAKTFNLFFLSMTAIIAFVFSIPFAFLLKKIVLYEKYIGIKNNSGKLIAIYSLEEIVSVTLGSPRNGSSIQVLMVRDGKLYKNLYSYLATAAGNTKLLELLSERNVVVK